MGDFFFDLVCGDFCSSLSDSMAINARGDVLMKMSDHMGLDVYTGELRIISGWDSDEIY